MLNKIRGIQEERVIWIDNRYISPEPSLSIRNHSPEGFNWGYSGSGSSQLALGILFEFTNRDTALSLYRKFREEIISKLPQTDFEIELDIKEWITKNKQ